MAKQKSIAEQVEEMQEANKKLADYEKLFDKACQINLGITAKSIQKILQKKEESRSNFEAKIRTSFGLKTDQDLAKFIAFLCNEKTINAFKNYSGHKE